MPYKPETRNPKSPRGFPEPSSEAARGITVHALKENKAPVGFVWPEAPKPKRTRKPS